MHINLILILLLMQNCYNVIFSIVYGALYKIIKEYS